VRPSNFESRGLAWKLQPASPNLPPQAGWAVPSCVPLRGKLIKSLIEHKAQRYAGQSRQTPSPSPSHLASPHLASKFRTFDAASKCRCFFCPLRPKRRREGRGGLEPRASTSAKLECGNPKRTWTVNASRSRVEALAPLVPVSSTQTRI
jgi:hypothetical protein